MSRLESVPMFSNYTRDLVDLTIPRVQLCNPNRFSLSTIWMHRFPESNNRCVLILFYCHIYMLMVTVIATITSSLFVCSMYLRARYMHTNEIVFQPFSQHMACNISRPVLLNVKFIQFFTYFLSKINLFSDFKSIFNFKRR